MTAIWERSENRTETTTTEWLACDRCGALIYGKRFTRSLHTCPECGWHARLDARARVEQLLDPGTARDVPVGPAIVDPLGFHDRGSYVDKLAAARDRTGQSDAVVVSAGEIGGVPVVLAVTDFRFLGGSLGVGAGEAITVAAETALRRRIPLLLVTASGGARMQEGLLSLMQMAKTASALAALDRAGLLTVTVVTDPTYGGVAASFATLTDVIVSEPGARMGFAGARVIEQTISQKLPDGFQTAEFLLDHGLVDGVWSRGELRANLGRLLALTGPADPLPAIPADPIVRDPGQVRTRPAWEQVGLARHIDRPTTLEQIGFWLDGFVELHGDRLDADDPAIVGGTGLLDGQPVMVIGHQKGHSTAELVKHRFGMPLPSGYRKAQRLMALAAKLGLPVITLIDTPGGYPGIEAEEHGQSIAIARCISAMAELPVPTVAVITGEGGSGGALALATADAVLMCANATYSVISPEGCAAILWQSAASADRAAEALGIDVASALRLGVADGMVPEPAGGAHTDPAAACEFVRRSVITALAGLRARDDAERLAARRLRLRRYGLSNGEE
ncbi:MAG TPA: acetyl-CoA carboxylase, carboxyltransferase subunit beta [Pseudonocardiaceae bacterium]|nr:acetyl-CoA carboxylase, carboxyltransferase subunit beta [Pseudonocardiaceae bacterium]